MRRRAERSPPQDGQSVAQSDQMRVFITVHRLETQITHDDKYRLVVQIDNLHLFNSSFFLTFQLLKREYFPQTCMTANTEFKGSW